MPSSISISSDTDIRPEALWTKMVRGGGWLLLLRLVERTLGLARIFVLARLLSPDDFGLIAIGLMAISLTRSIASTGFRQALVQKQGDVEDYLGTAWTVNFIRDLILAAAMVATAPLVAGFFDAPGARPVLQVLAVSWLLSGLRNIGTVHIHRRLAFRRFFVYQMSARSTEMIVSITAAVVFMNVWALVIGLLASNLAELVMSYVVAPRPKKIGLNLRQARELFQFGRWVMGSTAVGFLLLQLDRIVVGKIAGVATLGLYEVAYHISTLMSRELRRVLARMSFPAYARLLGEAPGDIGQAFLKLFQAATLLVIPVAFGTILLADGLVQHVLGDRWLSMTTTLQILAVFTILQTSSTMVVPLFNGLGRPDLLAKILAARLGILAVIIYPFTRWWGMEGAAIAVVVSSAIIDPVVWTVLMRLINIGIRDVLGALAPALAGGVTLAMVVLLAGGTVLQPDDLARFVGLAVAGGLGYLAGLATWAVVFHWDPLAWTRLNANAPPGDTAPDRERETEAEGSGFTWD